MKQIILIIISLAVLIQVNGDNDVYHQDPNYACLRGFIIINNYCYTWSTLKENIIGGVPKRYEEIKQLVINETDFDKACDPENKHPMLDIKLANLRTLKDLSKRRALLKVSNELYSDYYVYLNNRCCILRADSRELSIKATESCKTTNRYFICQYKVNETYAEIYRKSQESEKSSDYDSNVTEGEDYLSDDDLDHRDILPTEDNYEEDDYANYQVPTRHTSLPPLDSSHRSVLNVTISIEDQKETSTAKILTQSSIGKMEEAKPVTVPRNLVNNGSKNNYYSTKFLIYVAGFLSLLFYY